WASETSRKVCARNAGGFLPGGPRACQIPLSSVPSTHRTRTSMRALLLAFTIALLAPAGLAPAQWTGGAAEGNWVATWGTAQELYRRDAQPAGGGQGDPPEFDGRTVRMVVRTSMGGERVRVRIANAFGAPTVVLGGASLALRDTGATVHPESLREISFG